MNRLWFADHRIPEPTLAPNWPADFRSADRTPWTGYSLHRGVRQWHFALHECLGLLAHWVSGRAVL